MKRALCVGALALAGMFFPLTAQAGHRGGWGFDFGFGFDGGFFRAGFSPGRVCGTVCAPRRVHVHCPVAFYTSVWVPAVYDRVTIGYDRCGRPICRTVEVRCGHYESRLAGHRCSGCGATCD